MSAVASYSRSQRAAAAAAIVDSAGQRWGLLPYQVVRAADAAAVRVLRNQSVAGAVAAVRRAARAKVGAA